jgi:hypothetical protein
MPLHYNIASRYLSAAFDMLPCAIGLATLVLIAGIAPIVNVSALAALTVLVSLMVHTAVELLREVRAHA